MVMQKFHFCLLSYVARRLSNTLKIRFGDCVENEHRLHAAEIQSGNIRRDIRVWPGGSWQVLRLFRSRFAVKRKRLPGKIVVATVDLAWAKVCAIEKNLEPCRRFDLGSVRGICFRPRFLLRLRWRNAVQNQQSDDGETDHSIHSYAS